MVSSRSVYPTMLVLIIDVGTYVLELMQLNRFIPLQVLTEYMLVSMTSSVTVTIAGVVKEAVTILVWFAISSHASLSQIY